MIVKNQVVYQMSQDNEPVYRLANKSSIILETCDCFTDQIVSSLDKFNDLDWDYINPATGPIYVEDAKVGDVLAVTIKKIDINDQGVVATGKDLGVLGHLFEDNHHKIVPIKDNYALFNNYKIPLNKMIGVIGVAPAKGSISCGTPGSHGGNMDCKKICEGATLYLDVNVDGALLALGDLHACMGDGEIGVSGLEVSGQVEIYVEVIKNGNRPCPFIENDSEIITISSAITYEEAIKNVTKMMVDYLMSEYNFNLQDATMFCSLAGNLCFSQVVDPLVTIRFEINKSVLEGK